MLHIGVKEGGRKAETDSGLDKLVKMVSVFSITSNLIKQSSSFAALSRALAFQFF